MSPQWLSLAFLFFLAPATILRAIQPEESFHQKTWETLSDRNVSDWGQTALQIQPNHWKHGETDHFIIHCFLGGEMIGRRCEKFYAEIKEFFGNRPDLLQGRKSHIFAFNNFRDWEEFEHSVTDMRIAGITRGNEFFYIATTEMGQYDSRGTVQAHEMTHLVFNRFFKGRPPLWLNEGIAEYFGERKTTGLAEFRRRMGSAWKFNLDKLFSTGMYPRQAADIQSFYAESAIVVDFLTKTPERLALLPKFVDAMIADPDMDMAVQIYGYKDLAEFKSAYARYRQSF